MFAGISFCIGNATIEVNGHRFGLGELSVEALNFPRDAYAAMRHTLERAQEYEKKYERGHDLADWFSANEEYIQLDQQMTQHRIFHILREDSTILSEARQFTQQLSMFPEEDCELTETDMEILSQIEQYEDYLENPEDYGGLNPIPPEPPHLTRALLLYPGNTGNKWKYYKNFCGHYALALRDLESFVVTIGNFIRFYLSHLATLDQNNYVAALQAFMDDPCADKLIANPIRGTGFYTNADLVVLRHVPRETEEGSGVYKIYEYYGAEQLQTLLKMDFYRALEAGYVIRRCEFCGRYFLLKKAYHTKYCDLPNPENPQYTCAQLGYHLNGVKEAAGDDPKAQSLRRCKMRIDKDYSRAIINDEQREKLIRKAQDLFHAAHTSPDISNDEFEVQLASKNLYPLCGVERNTKKRGRPRANESLS